MPADIPTHIDISRIPVSRENETTVSHRVLLHPYSLLCENAPRRIVSNMDHMGVFLAKKLTAAAVVIWRKRAWLVVVSHREAMLWFPGH